MEEQVIAENESLEFNDEVTEVVETQTEEIANPQNAVEENEVQVETTVEPEKEPVKELNETQRVSARIKEEREKARQEAKDEVIAEMGFEWKGKPIKTESDYKKAMEEKKFEDDLVAERPDLPQEIIDELIESRRERQERKAREEEQQAIKEAEEKKTKEYNDLFDWYKSEYGKDINLDEMPKEVLEMNKAGKTLVDAYIAYDYKRIKVGQAIQSKNEENANSSAGSITGNGTTQEVVFTADYIENMTTKEMAKHWDNPAFRKAVGLK